MKECKRLREIILKNARVHVVPYPYVIGSYLSNLITKFFKY